MEGVGCETRLDSEVPKMADSSSGRLLYFEDIFAVLEKRLRSSWKPGLRSLKIR